MNYNHDDFLKLMEEIEFQSGLHLDQDCTPETFRLAVKPGGPEKARLTTGCGNPTLFEIPYAQESSDGTTATMGKVIACAVCDDLGRWPRFSHVLED